MINHKIVDISKILNRDDFSAKNIAIFCGAGISINSGLPAVKELKRYILTKLPIEEKDINEIMDIPHPFEQFIDSITNNSIIEPILNMYKNGLPNRNHYIIAELAKNGFVKTIITTNYDLLLEKAFEQVGLIEGIDFEKYYRDNGEKNFSQINFNSDKIILIKIHGSAEDNHTIRAAMNYVASKNLSSYRVEVINNIFFTGSHDKVLILGYSCSDEFDINNLITGIVGKRKQVIYIQHDHKKMFDGNNSIVYDIKEKALPNPFVEYQGYAIICNTDNIIDYINKCCNLNVEDSIFKEVYNWKPNIDLWGESLKNDKTLPFHLSAVIFENIGIYNKALEYYKKTSEIALTINDLTKASSCYLHIGNMEGVLGNYPIALEYYTKSLDICKKLNDEEGIAYAYDNIGIILSKKEDYKQSNKYHRKSLHIKIKLNDFGGQAKSYLNISTNSVYLMQPFEFIKNVEKALEIAEKVGNPYLVAECWGNKGVLLRRMGDDFRKMGYYQKADESYNWALEPMKLSVNEYKKLNYHIGLAKGLLNLANVYLNLGQYDDAIKNYEESLNYYRYIGDKHGLSLCQFNMHSAYLKKDDIIHAKEKLRASLSIAKANDYQDIIKYAKDMGYNI